MGQHGRVVNHPVGGDADHQDERAAETYGRGFHGVGHRSAVNDADIIFRSLSSDFDRLCLGEFASLRKHGSDGSLEDVGVGLCDRLGCQSVHSTKKS